MFGFRNLTVELRTGDSETHAQRQHRACPPGSLWQSPSRLQNVPILRYLHPLAGEDRGLGSSGRGGGLGRATPTLPSVGVRVLVPHRIRTEALHRGAQAAQYGTPRHVPRRRRALSTRGYGVVMDPLEGRGGTWCPRTCQRRRSRMIWGRLRPNPTETSTPTRGLLPRICGLFPARP